MKSPAFPKQKVKPFCPLAFVSLAPPLFRTVSAARERIRPRFLSPDMLIGLIGRPRGYPIPFKSRQG